MQSGVLTCPEDTGNQPGEESNSFQDRVLHQTFYSLLYKHGGVDISKKIPCQLKGPFVVSPQHPSDVSAVSRRS